MPTVSPFNLSASTIDPPEERNYLMSMHDGNTPTRTSKKERDTSWSPAGVAMLVIVAAIAAPVATFFIHLILAG